MFAQQGSSWYLRGIISASFLSNGQCDVSKYALYTNAAMFSKWVNEIVGKTMNDNSYVPKKKLENLNDNTVNLLCKYLTLEFEPTRILKGEEAVIPR